LFEGYFAAALERLQQSAGSGVMASVRAQILAAV
jgi:hypothetical protein